MQTQEIASKLGSQCGVLVEVRGQELIKRDYVDKSTGKAASFAYVAIAAEYLSSGKQITLEFFGKKGEEPRKFPIDKGQKCFATVKALNEQNGHVTARIEFIEPVEDSPGKKVA